MVAGEGFLKYTNAMRREQGEKIGEGLESEAAKSLKTGDRRRPGASSPDGGLHWGRVELPPSSASFHSPPALDM